MAGRRAGIGPRDLAARPGASQLDRASRTVVVRPRLLEVVEHVLRAVGRPDREKAVIVVLEAAAATHGDEPRIPDLREDHGPDRTTRDHRGVPGRTGRAYNSGMRRAPAPVRGALSTILAACAVALLVALVLAPTVLADDRDPRCGDWERHGVPPGHQHGADVPGRRRGRARRHPAR